MVSTALLITRPVSAAAAVPPLAAAAGDRLRRAKIAARPKWSRRRTLTFAFSTNLVFWTVVSVTLALVL
jgi:hypothetical protein